MNYSLEIEGLVSHKHKLEAEIARLRATFAMIARMKVMPDDKINRMTLTAAIEIANHMVGEDITP